MGFIGRLGRTQLLAAVRPAPHLYRASLPCDDRRLTLLHAGVSNLTLWHGLPLLSFVCRPSPPSSASLLSPHGQHDHVGGCAGKSRADPGNASSCMALPSGDKTAFGQRVLKAVALDSDRYVYLSTPRGSPLLPPSLSLNAYFRMMIKLDDESAWSWRRAPLWSLFTRHPPQPGRQRAEQRGICLNGRHKQREKPRPPPLPPPPPPPPFPPLPLPRRTLSLYRRRNT